MNKNENLVTKTTYRVKGKWFEPFFEKIIEYKEKHGSFYGITQDKEIGAKVKIIRRSYSGKATYRLTQEMIEKLNSIGFPWKAEYRDWFGPFFEKLVAYKEKHGNFYRVTKDKEIGPTANNIRNAYKGIGSVKLTPEMIEKLNSIGFTWVAEKNDWFSEFYEKLIAYKEEHSGFFGVTQDKEIGIQVCSVRCAYKGIGTTKLTQEMIEKLNSIGFSWEADINDYYAKWFPEFFEKVVAYKAKHGTFRGIIIDKEIGTTVSNIRCAYKGIGRTKLTQEMIDKLNSIGFPWQADKNEYQAKWFPEFYEKVVAYKEKHGTFNGITTDKEIGHKVGIVRCAYKGKGGTKLTQEMIDKLNEIGFSWEAEYGSWFDSFYEKFVAYKTKHGTFYGITQDKEIGPQVQIVRYAYKGKGGTKLTQEMINKLNSIGFPWSAKSKQVKEDDLTI